MCWCAEEACPDLPAAACSCSALRISVQGPIHGWAGGPLDGRLYLFSRHGLGHHPNCPRCLAGVSGRGLAACLVCSSGDVVLAREPEVPVGAGADRGGRAGWYTCARGLGGGEGLQEQGLAVAQKLQNALGTQCCNRPVLPAHGRPTAKGLCNKNPTLAQAGAATSVAAAAAAATRLSRCLSVAMLCRSCRR